MKPVRLVLVSACACDAENRLTGGVTASYMYDGDGNRVKEINSGATTVYLGNYFEWTGSTAAMKSYYYTGATRVAMRTGTPVTGTLNYLLGDHLGSTALTLDASGARLNTNTELRYYPYGGTRYNTNNQLTTYRFTGQRLVAGTGLYFYGARWYDPSIGRFLAPDTIVPNPGNPQALNRYAYVLGNPLRYTDPTGHRECEDDACLKTGPVILSYDNSTPSPGPAYTDEELYNWQLIISGEVGTGEFFRGPIEDVQKAARYVAWATRNVIEQGIPCTPQRGGCSKATKIYPYKSYADVYQLSQVYNQKRTPIVPDPDVAFEVQRVFDLPAGTPNPIQDAEFYLALEFYQSNMDNIEVKPVEVVFWFAKMDMEQLPRDRWTQHGIYFFVEWPVVR